MKRHFLNVCAALFALMVLCSVTARAADNVYAILYDDGTLTFQHGNTPESGKTVTKTYEVDLNKVYTGYPYAPWFDERKTVRMVNFADKISPTSTVYWFYDCPNLERVANIRNLDAAKVTTMSSMFYGCSGLTGLDVSHFDTANVTDMSNMFRGCSGLTVLDVSHFDTKNVTIMNWMFCGCSGLTALDVSHFDTTKVTDMRSMFADCSGLTELDVSHFDTANVTDVYCMFWGCSGLTALDVSKFDTAKIQCMSYMFKGCSKLKIICASDKFITTSVPEGDWRNSYNMFKDCTSLVGGNGTKYDEKHTDKAYARIDTASAPGYFTAPATNPQPNPQPEPEPEPEPETYLITAYAGEGGTVSPAGDTRVSAGGSQKYVMTPNPGYRVQSVRMDAIDIGALSEYVFQNVSGNHSLIVTFEKLPHYAITSAVVNDGELSVTLENSGAVTVAVSYFDKNGKFLSVDMLNVSANAGNVTFALPFAYKARVVLFDSVYCPLCDPVTVR